MEDEIDMETEVEVNQSFANNQIASHPSVCEESSTCGSQVLDVLVVYTTFAMSQLGGESAAEAAIAAAMQELNLATTNSGVNTSFNLVHTQRVNYTESGSARTDRDRLTDPSDGFLDNLHVARDLYGADIVSLIIGSGGCGIAYIQEDPTFMDPQKGFNVVEDGCMTGNLTFTHEIGHNIGLRHDRYVDPNVTPCNHHHGYVNEEALLPGSPSSSWWRTIMAYGNSCSIQGISCSRLPFWSNPDITFNGDPMGINIAQNNPANAAYGLNRTSCVASQFSEPSSNDIVWAVSSYLENPFYDNEGKLLYYNTNFNGQVDFDLYKGGQFHSSIESDVDIFDFQTITLSGLENGCDYEIRISKTGDPSVYGTVPSFCYGDYLEVIEPNIGGTYDIFNYMDIKGLKGFPEPVDLELYKAGQYLTTIAQSWDAQGTYQWLVSDTFDASCDYVIRIRKSNDASVFDESDQPFCFQLNGFAITSPISDITWTPGQFFDVEWISSLPENADLILRGPNSSFVYTLASNIPNNGYFGAMLPLRVKPGCEYTIELVIHGGTLSRESPADICISSGNQFAFRAKVVLGGAVEADGTMRNDLLTAGYVPTSQPYPSVAAFSTSFEALQNGNNPIVDWIWLELRTGPDPSTAVAREAFLLAASGDIVLPGQVAAFFGVPNVGHRNHLAVMTDVPYQFQFGSFPFIDLRKDLYQVNEEPGMSIANDRLALWPGDVNEDSQVRYSGSQNDRVEILNITTGPTPFNLAFGYLAADTNLDGKAVYAGTRNDRVIILDTTEGPTPFDIKKSQVPSQ